MDVNVLKTFVAVCEYGGFSAAGEVLGYTQSTVSSQIRQLEKELNTVLLDRFHHRISMTQDGITVLNHAKKILATQEKMVAELHQVEHIAGELCLAMPSSISARYFEHHYLGFQEQYPEIHLKIMETGTEQMFDMLRKNEADVVFTLDAHIYNSEFEICAERQEQTHFVAAPDHPLLSRKKLTVRDMMNEDFIMTERGMSYRKLLDAYLASESLEIRPMLEIGNPLQICSIVSKSNSVSFLPDFITGKYVENGQLAYLPVEDCFITVWTQILLHKNKWHSPALKALVDYYNNIITNESASGKILEKQVHQKKLKSS